MIYALWVDELTGLEQTRHTARERLDEYLATPFDPVQAQDYRRERFGMTGEELLERQQSEAVWGD